jgi:hypothetical protein
LSSNGFVVLVVPSNYTGETSFIFYLGLSMMILRISGWVMLNGSAPESASLWQIVQLAFS